MSDRRVVGPRLMVFYYYTQKFFVTKAGKVLANWKYPEKHVSAATLDAFLTSANADQVREYGDELFAMAQIASMLNGELKEVRNLLLSTLLMYYRSYSEKHGV